MKLQPSCKNLDCKLNWLFSDFSVEAVVLTGSDFQSELLDKRTNCTEGLKHVDQKTDRFY